MNLTRAEFERIRDGNKSHPDTINITLSAGLLNAILAAVDPDKLDAENGELDNVG